MPELLLSTVLDFLYLVFEGSLGSCFSLLCAHDDPALLSLRQRHRVREPVGLSIRRVLPLGPVSCHYHHSFGLGAGFGNRTDQADLGLIEAAHDRFAVDPTIGYEEAWVALGSLQLLMQGFHC
jgi:hypothetical protein